MTPRGRGRCARLAFTLDDAPECPACLAGERHAHRLGTPDGLCECGCGGRPSIARRFILGHRKRFVPLHARFWEKVRVTSGCWEWTGRRTSSGYGQIALTDAGRRTMRAPRVAWLLSNGAIPPGLLVLHRCDNPPCVNPDHLFLGTDMDNARDKIAKGRDASGARNGRARLIATDVKDIRHRLAEGERKNSIGRVYGVDRSTIRRIANGRHWCRAVGVELLPFRRVACAHCAGPLRGMAGTCSRRCSV